MRRRITPQETRARIVRAAGEVFGRHGFDGTTIRQITKRAGVNVAAVNYHFRDKAELYLRVLREAKSRTLENAVFPAAGTPEHQLRGFIFRFVRSLLDPERPAWHTQVITQEMMRPTPALDLLVREMTEPIFRQLRSVLVAAAGTKLPDVELDLLASSVFGQCLFYVRSRPMLERLAPELAHGADRVGRIAGHITTFTLAALCHLYKNKKPPARNGAASPRNRIPALHTS